MAGTASRHGVTRGLRGPDDAEAPAQLLDPRRQAAVAGPSTAAPVTRHLRGLTGVSGGAAETAKVTHVLHVFARFSTSKSLLPGLKRLDQISSHLLRVGCRRCGRTLEIQKVDAIRLYGPEALWKAVGQRLLDNTCPNRSGRHEEDGCWPSFDMP